MKVIRQVMFARESLFRRYWSAQNIDFEKDFMISAEIYLGAKDDGADGMALVFQAKDVHRVPSM